MTPVGAFVGPDRKPLWIIRVRSHPTEDRMLVLTCATDFDLQVAEAKAQAMARPPHRLPPGPERDAVLALARALGRRAAERRFGSPPSPNRTTRGN